MDGGAERTGKYLQRVLGVSSAWPTSPKPKIPGRGSAEKSSGRNYPAGARMPERASGAVVESSFASFSGDSFHQITFQGFDIGVAGV